MSTDLEDIVTLLDGRKSTLDEIEQSEQKLRGYLREEVSRLLNDTDFIDMLPGHLPGDLASQARLPLLLDLLRHIAQ